MAGLPTRLAPAEVWTPRPRIGPAEQIEDLRMTQISNDPKSCMFSSYLRCWPDPPGPRSNLIKTIGSLRLVFQSARIW